MEDRSLLLRHMGDTPNLRIIDFFLDNPGSDYSKKEIIEHTGMSKTTLYKIWSDILELGLLSETRRFGKARLYVLNLDSPLVQIFRELDGELGKHAMRMNLDAPARQVDPPTNVGFRSKSAGVAVPPHPDAPIQVVAT